MREIKFRAWDKLQKVMMPVSEINFGDEALALTICFYGEKTKDKYPKPLVNGENGILMQFTGLKDKNGKEIYEGDIVRWKRNDAIFVISWRQSAWKMERLSGAYSYPIFSNVFYQTKIIGNIYENPELLPPQTHGDGV